MAGRHSPGAIDVVVPTLGRPSLRRLLTALEPQADLLGQIFIVDDRSARSGATYVPIESISRTGAVLEGAGRGPAAARNRGWRASRAEWVAFLDDDVVPAPDWAARLRADLEGLGPAVAASQGRVRVPLPADRAPNDWERNVAGLERGSWISADIAVRREALEAAGGFDERFRRAYREDTDLALRLQRGGWQLVPGTRAVEHPVPAAGFWISVSRQRGNADDVLMRALHGRHWRRWGRAPRGRLPRHLLASGSLAVALAALGRRRPALAAVAALAWLASSAELAAARIRPGPRGRSEVLRMLTTSAVLPLAATAWSGWGLLRLPFLRAGGGLPRSPRAPDPTPDAVLLDRDGTIVFDVPYNGDPRKVVPVPGAARALQRLRSEGLALAVVSNQSGIGRGLLGREQVEAVNRRAEQLLGPLGPWLYCPHAPDDGCACRKPEPGLVLAAAERLGVDPDRCVVIGDVAADVQAAQAAGAAAVLVPTPRTEREDVRRAPRVAATIEAAVAQLLPEPEEGLGR